MPAAALFAGAQRPDRDGLARAGGLGYRPARISPREPPAAMTLPNFLIIGAPKAGTTSLYEHFRAHPQIFMPRIKEPRWFGYDGSGDRLKFPVQSLAEYEALFEGAADAIAIGEATPHYLLYPQAAERIHAAIPEARLIAALRNPVDRAHSIYEMNRRNKGVNADLPFAAALAADPNLRESYAPHLARFFALFPAAQIRVILLEDLEARPGETLAELFGFLGVEPGFRPEMKIANPGGAPRNRLLHSVLSNKRLIAAARDILPESLIAPFKALRSRNLEKRPLGAAERRAAAEIFREDIARTSALIGRDLSHWLAA